MTRFPYFPLFMLNFLADTAHLTKAQKWDYLTLLWDMWLHDGWIEDNDREIARKLKLTLQQWRAFRPLIQPLLISKDQKLSQKKLLSELLAAKKKQEKFRLRSQKANLARAENFQKRFHPRDNFFTPPKSNKINDITNPQGLLKDSYKEVNKKKDIYSTLSTSSATNGSGSAAMASSPGLGGRSSATPSDNPYPDSELPAFGSFAARTDPTIITPEEAELIRSRLHH